MAHIDMQSCIDSITFSGPSGKARKCPKGCDHEVTFLNFFLQKRVEGTEEFRIQTMVTLVTNVISLAFLLPSFFIMTVALSR